MQKKQGISLIVLVITIIVMIILAAAIILSLNNAGIIGNANKAVSETDYKTVQTAAQLKYADIILGKSIGELWTGQYIKEQLIADGVITEEQATRYRFRNNGGVIKLQTEAEYNAMYKTELAALDESYYTITDGKFTLTTAGINAVNNANLTILAIPYGVTTINYKACYECTNLEKVIMPDTVTLVGSCAFENCTNLEEVIFSKNLKNVAGIAFKGTKWLQEKQRESNNGLIIEQGVLINGDAAKGDIKLPESVEVIGAAAFSGNKNIDSVIIPATVESIEYDAFYRSSLKNIEFLGNMPELADCSFGNTNLPEWGDTYNKMIEKNISAFDM